jgi:outer membrane protein assembly factor BamB
MKMVNVLLAVSAWGLTCQTLAQETWSQWRGPSRDGQVVSTTVWPARLSESNLQQSWRLELADGYSSPIIDSQRVYTVETKDKSHEVVRAIDRKTGKQLWETSWKGAMKVPFFARKNGSWARCTPLIFDKRLYVGGIRDELVCIEPESGNIIWTVDFKERYGTPVPAFGYVSSPLADDTGIYTQAGGGLVKVDRLTGEEIWRTLTDGGGMFGSAFSSPRFATLHGTRQLLVQTRTSLAGVDPKEGTVLWQHDVPAFRGMNIIPPVPYGDAVFTSTYGGGTRMFDVHKTPDGAWSATERWKTTLQGYMSSPVVIGSHVYWHLRNQRIACYNLDTGEQAWRSSESFGKYVSMAVNGNRALALDQRGELFLLHLSPEQLTVVDKVTLSGDESWAHVAICGDIIFVREQKAIVAYRWGLVSTSAPRTTAAIGPARE